jgi:hypothetical protein
MFNNKGYTSYCVGRATRVETNGSKNMRAPAVGRRAHGMVNPFEVEWPCPARWAVRELQRRICEVGCDSTASESKERAEEVARESDTVTSAVDSTKKSCGMETKQMAGARGHWLAMRRSGPHLARSHCQGPHLNLVVPALPAGRPLATATERAVRAQRYCWNR